MLSASVVGIVVLVVFGWSALRSGAGADGGPAIDAAAASSSSSTTDDGLGGGIRETDADVWSPSYSAEPKKPQEVYAACKAEVAAAEGVVDAAAQVADHWGSHVEVQAKLNSGSFSAAQAEDAWKQTKSEGASDVADFESTLATYQDVKGSCSEGLEDTYGSSFADKMAFCNTRLDDLKKVISTGDAITEQWKGHLAAAGTTIHERGSEWLSEVSDAQTALAAYDDAVSALKTTTTC